VRRPARGGRGPRPTTGPPLPQALAIETLELDGELLVVFAFPREPRTSLRALTVSEQEVAELALQGFTTAQIAAARSVTSATISAQLQSIYRKLCVGSRTELAHKIEQYAERSHKPR
jgi:DNA-binding NarL/FixJ family response regulator